LWLEYPPSSKKAACAKDFMDSRWRPIAENETKSFHSRTLSHYLLKPSIMKRNMGIVDRSIRILIAMVVAVLFFLEIISGTLGIVLLIAAGVFVLTSIVSFCPLYTLLGINTCKTK
jgi:hypothetical protein